MIKQLKKKISIVCIGLITVLVTASFSADAAGVSGSSQMSGVVRMDSDDNITETDHLDEIVKVMTVYVDQEGNRYYVKQGTGFIIGSNISGSSAYKYVITDYGVVAGEKTMADTIKEQNGMNMDERLSLEYYAVGDMGMMTKLELKSYSEDTNYAILTVSEGLAEKTYARLGNPDKIEDKARVSIIGYSGKRNLLDYTATEERSIVTKNTIITEITEKEYYNEKIIYFQIGETVPEGLSGSPVYDNEGCVSGMYVYVDGTMKVMSVSSIYTVLDSLDVPYMTYKDDATYDVPSAELVLDLENLVRDNKKYLSSIKRNKYTETTWNNLYNAVSTGESVLNKSISSKKEYEDTIKLIKKARKKIKTVRFKWIVINCILGVVIIIFISLIIKCKKKKKVMLKERNGEE